MHCWNSCKWKITRYKIQNWYRYLNMNREWTDMNSNTIFYCALCHHADDPFFDVSACANSVCQIDFVVAENYRCRTHGTCLHLLCTAYFTLLLLFVLCAACRCFYFASSILGFTPNFRWKWQFCVCTDVNAKLCTNMVFCML